MAARRTPKGYLATLRNPTYTRGPIKPLGRTLTRSATCSSADIANRLYSTSSHPLPTGGGASPESGAPRRSRAPAPGALPPIPTSGACAVVSSPTEPDRLEATAAATPTVDVDVESAAEAPPTTDVSSPEQPKRAAAAGDPEDVAARVGEELAAGEGLAGKGHRDDGAAEAVAVA